MNRHEQRVVAMQSVYQHLLLGKDQMTLMDIYIV